MPKIGQPSVTTIALGNMCFYFFRLVHFLAAIKLYTSSHSQSIRKIYCKHKNLWWILYTKKLFRILYRWQIPKVTFEPMFDVMHATKKTISNSHSWTVLQIPRMFNMKLDGWNCFVTFLLLHELSMLCVCDASFMLSRMLQQTAFEFISEPFDDRINDYFKAHSYMVVSHIIY